MRTPILLGAVLIAIAINKEAIFEALPMWGWALLMFFIIDCCEFLLKDRK